MRMYNLDKDVTDKTKRFMIIRFIAAANDGLINMWFGGGIRRLKTPMTLSIL